MLLHIGHFSSPMGFHNVVLRVFRRGHQPNEPHRRGWQGLGIRFGCGPVRSQKMRPKGTKQENLITTIIPREISDANGQLIRNMEAAGRITSIWEMEQGSGDCPFNKACITPYVLDWFSPRKKWEEISFHDSRVNTEVVSWLVAGVWWVLVSRMRHKWVIPQITRQKRFN